MVNTPEVPGFERAGGALASYLRAVAAEADARNYRCDKSKIARHSLRGKLAVTEGQLRYEQAHLSDELKTRAPERLVSLPLAGKIETHPLLHVVPGDIEPREVIRNTA